MKKLLFLMLLFNVLVASAQTVTERWNNLSSRYEYFGSDGTMIGYKQYNSLKRTWEYYEVENEPVYEVKSNVNVDLTRQTLQQKQQRYDYNKQRIQNTINHLDSVVTNSGGKPETIKRIKDRISKIIETNLNGHSVDLSIDANAESIINWLYTTYDRIVTEETQ